MEMLTVEVNRELNILYFAMFFAIANQSLPKIVQKREYYAKIDAKIVKVR